MQVAYCIAVVEGIQKAVPQLILTVKIKLLFGFKALFAFFFAIFGLLDSLQRLKQQLKEGAKQEG
ncbi:hypothetical protein C5S35_09680 [Candidatus Methanophagaceae archaeon]|nr:hypothetical protein C5S35_09680 [Methanophagales archaeon]